jgi:hypothetical protein
MASTNASIGNEEFPEILKGRFHEMKWRAIPDTDPKVDLRFNQFCDDTDLVTNLVTKQKARVKRASDSS